MKKEHFIHSVRVVMLPEEIPTYISTVLEFCGKPDFSFCLPDLNARKEPGF